MTSEEAMEKLRAEASYGCTEASMQDFINFAVALGMLKLDEPKSAGAVLDESESADTRLVIELGWPKNGISHRALRRALKETGMKIVEQ